VAADKKDAKSAKKKGPAFSGGTKLTKIQQGRDRRKWGTIDSLRGWEHHSKKRKGLLSHLGNETQSRISGVRKSDGRSRRNSGAWQIS